MEQWLSPNEIKIVSSASIVIGMWLMRFFFIRLLNKYSTDISVRTVWRQSINFISMTIVILLLVRVWFAWFQSIITLLSVIAAAVTVVSKEIILNILSYGVIVWRSLFNIGDRIQIGTTSGDVVQLGIMYLSVVEVKTENMGDGASGRLVKIPNKEVLDKHVVNYSRGAGLLWNEIEVTLPLGTNWEKAKTIIEKILNEENHQLTKYDWNKVKNRDDELMFVKEQPSTLLNLNGGKYVLLCRYLCRCDDLRDSRDRIWTKIIHAFEAESDVYFEK